MADVTAIPVPIGGSPFDVPADFKRFADTVGGQTRFSRANAAALPAAGNWPGRLLMTEDAGDLYEWQAGAWRVVAGIRTSGVIAPAAGFAIDASTRLVKQTGLATLTPTFTRSNTALPNDTLMGMLPVGFRPAARTRGGSVLFASGQPGGFNLDTNGEIRVYNASGVAAVALIAFSTTYVVA